MTRTGIVGLRRVHILKAFDTFCKIALPENVLQMCTQTSRLCKSPFPCTPPQHRGLSFCFPHLLPIMLAWKKKKGILFSFAFLWSLVMLSTCHIFISHLWFSLLSVSFVRFSIEAPIFSLMIYKSSECTCFPEARPSCAGSLSGCYADVPVVGPVSMATDAQVSVRREWGALPWWYPSWVWLPSHSLSGFPGHSAKSLGTCFAGCRRTRRVAHVPRQPRRNLLSAQ